MLAFMFSFVLAMTAVFAGSPAIGPDIENGLLLAMLARPIRRSEVMLGRWLGLAVVLVAYALAAGYLELGAVVLATGYAPADPLAAPLYLALEALILLTLAIVLSTRVASVAGGAIAVVAYGLAWMAGVMGGVGEAFNNDVLRWAGIVAKLILPSDVLWLGSAAALTPTDEVLRGGGLAEPALYKFSPFSGSLEHWLWGACCCASASCRPRSTGPARIYGSTQRFAARRSTPTTPILGSAWQCRPRTPARSAHGVDSSPPLPSLTGWSVRPSASGSCARHY
jgi:hypothetical protein